MPKTLLLADDSVTIQKVVGICLAGENINIINVDNGEDAVSMAVDIKPDMVIADVAMPGKNGYEVAHAIKHNPLLKDIPVLLLAGAFEVLDDRRYRDSLASAYIMKPFESQALINLVTGLLSPATAAGVAEAKPAPTPPAPPPPPKPFQTQQFSQYAAQARTQYTQTPPATPPQPSTPPAPADSRPLTADISGLDDFGSDEIFNLDTTAATEPDPAVLRSEPPPPEKGYLESSSAIEMPVEPAGEPVQIMTAAESAQQVPSETPGADSPVLELENPLPPRQPDSAEPVLASGVLKTADQQYSPEELKALVKKSIQEVVERVVWEVVPELAETIIRAELKRLLAEEESKD
ncbi:MAG: response regulator [Myxococcota bacterium]|jgi:CheY-like chemotaxis protein